MGLDKFVVLGCSKKMYLKRIQMCMEKTLMEHLKNGCFSVRRLMLACVCAVYTFSCVTCTVD